MRTFKIVYADRQDQKRTVEIKCANEYKVRKALYTQLGFRCYVYNVIEIGE